MSLISKIKNKLLNSSGMYNHYKKESNILSNDINNELKDLKREFKKYKKTNNRIQKSYNNLFNISIKSPCFIIFKQFLTIFSFMFFI